VETLGLDRADNGPRAGSERRAVARVFPELDRLGSVRVREGVGERVRREAAPAFEGEERPSGGLAPELLERPLEADGLGLIKGGRRRDIRLREPAHGDVAGLGQPLAAGLESEHVPEIDRPIPAVEPPPARDEGERGARGRHLALDVAQ
jgi:hypothetical protein